MYIYIYIYTQRESYYLLYLPRWLKSPRLPIFVYRVSARGTLQQRCLLHLWKMAMLVLTRMTTSLLFVSPSASTDPSTDPSIPYPIHGPITHGMGFGPELITQAPSRYTAYLRIGSGAGSPAHISGNYSNPSLDPTPYIRTAFANESASDPATTKLQESNARAAPSRRSPLVHHRRRSPCHVRRRILTASTHVTTKLHHRWTKAHTVSSGTKAIWLPQFLPSPFNPPHSPMEQIYKLHRFMYIHGKYCSLYVSGAASAARKRG